MNHNPIQDFRDGAVTLADIEDDTNAVISWDGEGLIISTGIRDRDVPNEHVVATDIPAIYQLRDFLNNVIAALEEVSN